MSEDTTRATQENNSRENSKRDTDAWIPASSLPQPDRRDGIRHRWIRTSMLGQADNTNVSQKMREGWVPCIASEYPEIDFRQEDDTRYPNNIEYGGLLLCSIPEEQLDKRHEYYNKIAVSQMEAVDNNFLREEDPRMPLYKENSSRTTFGKR
jgi:hypothetical protein